MRRDYVGLWSPAIGAEGGLLAYGHHGRPLLVFQSEQGRCSDYEDRGMIDAIAGLIEAGRVKVYSVDSYDAASWCDPNLPLEARAVQHGRFEDWIRNQVVPFIYDDCQGVLDVMVTGASFGAFHAANALFRRPDLFDAVIAMSGFYDLGPDYLHGYSDDNAFFNNPAWYLPGLGGDDLHKLQTACKILILTGQGAYEAPDASRFLSKILHSKAIPHFLDIWGHDVAHDWPWWLKMLPYAIDLMGW